VQCVLWILGWHHLASNAHVSSSRQALSAWEQGRAGVPTLPVKHGVMVH